MKGRHSLILVALFALAFLGSLLALKLARPVAAEPLRVAAAAPLQRVAAAPPRVPMEAQATVATPSALESASVSDPRPAPGPAPTPALSPPIPDAPPPVAEVPATSVREAVDALRHSMNPSDRASAIQLLGEAARGGGDVARIRMSLRQASTDPDPDVAARAQEEYERLVEHDENR